MNLNMELVSLAGHRMCTRLPLDFKLHLYLLSKKLPADNGTRSEKTRLGRRFEKIFEGRLQSQIDIA
jgi:hypothetical protein